jgi:hypothetical protein
MALNELSSVPAAVRFPIGLLAAGAAVLVMDLLMARLPEGTTPPKVAAGVLTRTAVDDAPARLASLAHYLAGVGTGLLFVYVSILAEWLLGGASLLSVGAATITLYVLMVAFFLLVPLPRAPGLSQARRSTTGRDWAIAAAGYLAVLVPISVGLTLVFA